MRGGGGDEYLFPNENGVQLTENGLRCTISKYNKRHGVEKTSVPVPLAVYHPHKGLARTSPFFRGLEASAYGQATVAQPLFQLGRRTPLNRPCPVRLHRRAGNIGPECDIAVLPAGSRPACKYHPLQRPPCTDISCRPTETPFCKNPPFCIGWSGTKSTVPFCSASRWPRCHRLRFL